VFFRAYRKSLLDDTLSASETPEQKPIRNRPETGHRQLPPLSPMAYNERRDSSVGTGMTQAAIGPYRIIRKLGEGGMGTVYEAFHDAIERRVAIKILRPSYAHNPETLKRFF
jgi:serine/threonine protein kinase